MKRSTRFLDKARKWIAEGNDCEHCPCSWESRCEDDWDAGCYMGVDWCDSICRWPLFVRRYMARKANYYLDHEYDGIEEWLEREDKMHGIIAKAIQKELGFEGVICWRDCFPGVQEEKLHEYDQEEKANRIAWTVWSDVQHELVKEKPLNLRGEWAALVKKTGTHIIRRIHEILTF